MDPRKRPPVVTSKPVTAAPAVSETQILNKTLNDSTRSRSVSNSPSREQLSASKDQSLPVAPNNPFDQQTINYDQQLLQQNFYDNPFSNQQYSYGSGGSYSGYRDRDRDYYYSSSYREYGSSSADLSASDLLKQCSEQIEMQAKREAAGEIPIGPKHERQLYVGNLPPTITHQKLVELLNIALNVMKLNIKPGLPVLSAWISQDGHYAFVEFRTVEECMAGHNLNQIAILGHPLKVGKTRIQNQMGNGTIQLAVPTSSGSQVLILSQALSNCIEISNIPKQYEHLLLPAEAVNESAPTSHMSQVAASVQNQILSPSLAKLLKMFGCYKNHYLKSLANQLVCYCEYENEELTKKALNGFQDLLVKENKLQVRRLANGQANQIFGHLNSQTQSGFDQGSNGTQNLQNLVYTGGSSGSSYTEKQIKEILNSRVVILNNLLVLENMKSKQDFYEVEDDVRDECEKFGKIRQIIIPKPNHLSHRNRLPIHMQVQRYGQYQVNEGAGKIYIKFERSESARKCVEGIVKRLFNNREVQAYLYSEEKWYDRILE